MTRTSTPRAFAAPSACTTSSRPSSYISTITRSWAEPISPLTRVKMLASCQRRTSAPGGGPSGRALAGREQPARERRMESKQAARTTAGKNYAARVQAPTQPVKEPGLDRLHPHARPRAEQLVGSGFAHANLEVPHAADIHERLPGPRFRVCLGRGDDVVVEIGRASCRERVEIAVVEVPVNDRWIRAVGVAWNR